MFRQFTNIFKRFLICSNRRNIPNKKVQNERIILSDFDNLQNDNYNTDDYENNVNDSHPLISLNNLNKVYKTKRKEIIALDNVSLNLKYNETTILIGPNGCGKSTLINSIIGSTIVDSGSLEIENQNYWGNFIELQKLIGVCFQENILFPIINVYETLRVFCILRGIYNKEDIDDTISNICTMMELNPKSVAFNLSGGQKRKLCVAIALIGSPPIIIMDEPTTAIDVSTRKLIWKTINSFTKTTCLITLHTLEEAESVSDRLLVMRKGKIIFNGTTEKLRIELHCGYKLRIVEESREKNANNFQSLISLVKKHTNVILDGKETDGTILIPNGPYIVDLLEEIDRNKTDLNIKDYTLNVQNLEDVILLLFSDEKNQNE